MCAHRSVERKIIDLEKCIEIYIYFCIYFAACVSIERTFQASVCVFVISSESHNYEKLPCCGVSFDEKFPIVGR